MAEITTAIEKRRQERCRAERDCIDGNRGNQKEDRAPPVVAAHVNAKCQMLNAKSFGICHLAFVILAAAACGTTAVAAVGTEEAAASGDSMYRPKIIFPAVVCSTLVTTMSIVLLIIRRALSTTTIVPSSR